MSDVSLTDPAAIAVNGLSHRIGSFCLGPVDLVVPAGSITALIGPNGAGKTTLLDLLYGMGAAQQGHMTLAGLDPRRAASAMRQQVAYVTPDVSFAAWGRVGGVLDYLRGFYAAWSDVECDRLLSLFELGRSDRVSGLSFGERTRLALVAALARETSVLLLDEPTTGLDVAARKHLFAELLAYMEPGNRAIVISSHQLSDLERLADRVAVLHRGQLRAAGAIADFTERYEQWDIALNGKPLSLPSGVHPLLHGKERMRVMADLQAGADDFARSVTVLARAPMTLEEVYLGLTGEAA